MSILHIIQCGIKNLDRRRLDNAARRGLSLSSWIVPKSAHIDEAVVVFIPGVGMYATAKVKSRPVVRKGWHNRYGAVIGSVQLINPPISLGVIQREIPELSWARYPRGIKTAPPVVSEKIRSLIDSRRKEGVNGLKENMLASANLAELRAAAVLKSAIPRGSAKREIAVRLRSNAIRNYALRRANGWCEACKTEAPFRTAAGKPFLEVHHMTRAADQGPDHPANVIAVCPNCHRRSHHALNADAFNESLRKRVHRIEAKLFLRS
jgi:hypothetical protein